MEKINIKHVLRTGKGPNASFMRDILWRNFPLGYASAILFMIGMLITLHLVCKRIGNNIVSVLFNLGVNLTAVTIGVNAAFLAGPIISRRWSSTLLGSLCQEWQPDSMMSTMK